jgi:hypothetical protein
MHRSSKAVILCTLGVAILVTAMCASCDEASAPAAAAPVADYVFYVRDGVCYAINGRSGILEESGRDHSSVIQHALDAMAGGTYEFSGGDYEISAPLRPADFQTWRFASRALFRPAGDNSILNILDCEQLSFQGVLRIDDPVVPVDGFVTVFGQALDDRTAAAQDATDNDFPLMSTAPQADDAIYFGKQSRFNMLELQIGTAGIGEHGGWTTTVEYWSDSDGSWKTIANARNDTVTDPDEPAFSREGTCHIFFKDLPGDWARKDVAGRALYWVRLRMTSIRELSSPPLGSQAFVRRTCTAAAIEIDDLDFSNFESLFIRNYFDGIRFAGTNGTRENTFADIYLHCRNSLMTMSTNCHDNHFLNILGKGVSEFPLGHSTGDGINIDTSGTHGGNVFGEVVLVDTGRGVYLQRAAEVFFTGLVSVDGAREEAVAVLGGCERIFFDQVWASSSGDGFVLCGDRENPLDDGVTINSLVARSNAGRGFYVKHDVRKVHVGSLQVSRNDWCLQIGEFENANVSEISIGTLMSWENQAVGVDSVYAGPDTYCDVAVIHDACDLRGFARIGGNCPGVGYMQNGGEVTVPQGSTYLDVPHGLCQTPVTSGVQITPTNSLGNASKFWISDVGPETFRINVDTDPGPSGARFWWGATLWGVSA